MDELETLLAEALQHELHQRRGKGTINRLSQIRDACHAVYSNPENWTASRTIALVHVESGETLGLFQEYLHKKTIARKLCRIEAGDNPVEERVSGPEWLGGYVHRVDPPTESEIARIRAAWLPRTWKPAWKHLTTKRARPAPRTADEMLEELSAPSEYHQAH